jgi:hypothetical protein
LNTKDSLLLLFWASICSASISNLSHKDTNKWSSDACAACIALLHDAFMLMLTFLLDTGAPVGRRSLLSDSHADPIISSVLDVRWVARLEGLASNMSTRVPFPKETLPSPSPAVDSDAGDDNLSDTAQGSTATTAPTKASSLIDTSAHDSTTATSTTATARAAQAQSEDVGMGPSGTTNKAAEDATLKVCDVFTAKDTVPLASAWGIEDCSATLSSAFGALAQTLQERPGDGDAALRLYEHNKILISLVRVLSSSVALSVNRESLLVQR